MKLRREAPTPLYLQLKNALVSDIDGGRYKPHERLMSERELGEKFKVSRMTVRQALTEMIREGILYTQVGKGTYVSESKIKQELQTLTGFSQDMIARGTVASGQVLEARVIPATLALYGVLQAVDGVALKQAVNVWASAPDAEKAARGALPCRRLPRACAKST